MLALLLGILPLTFQQAAGIKLIVSAFGSTEAPTSSGTDPTDVANTIASFVKTYNLDGVDVDYEVIILSFFRNSTMYSRRLVGLQCYQCWRWQGRGLVDNIYSAAT